VEIRQIAFEVARWPLSTVRNIGSFVIEVTGREDYTHRLLIQEPFSRAITALRTASRATHKDNPDQDLARFEVMRAANAINEMSMIDPELAAEMGHEVVEAALELPNNEINYKIAEQATEASMDRLVAHYIPYQRPPSD
jgi:hypothetical protein